MLTITTQRLIAAQPSARAWLLSPALRSMARQRHLSTSPSSSTTTQTPTDQFTKALPDDAAPAPSGGPQAGQIVKASPQLHAQQWRNSRPWEDWVMHHPVYTKEEVEAVAVVHHDRKTLGDKFAAGLVDISRWLFDRITGYKHSSPEAAREALEKAGLKDAPLEVLRQKGYVMDVPQWMARILFLESIAGVPGMVAGTLRHLQSLRLMRRDGGWIGTLLEEAQNERMHLMTFMQIRNPSMFFRLIVLGAQGVFYNAFFLGYLIAPKLAHRWVGFLEEQACVTYTGIIDEIRRGNIPEWGDGPDAQKVPQIAKDYWQLPDSATMIDLILAVRADEAGHRYVNHTLAELDQKHDFNPFGMRYPNALDKGTKVGLTREESLQLLKEVEEEYTSKRNEKEAPSQPSSDSESGEKK